MLYTLISGRMGNEAVKQAGPKLHEFPSTLRA